VTAISKPMIGEEEQAAVRTTLVCGLVAQGRAVAEFERAFAGFIGTKHAIATSNGTTALHTALLAHGVGPGDEVITSDFTFIASASAVLHAGARPVLVDIDENFHLAPHLVERAITPRTKAIIPVHLYGQPASMNEIMRIATANGLSVIEDACQAHGAEFESKKAGAFGTGCFSFYATKNMTTGEGGMITTDDDDVAEKARLLISHGSRTRYYHEVTGYNNRMTDIAACIGIEQLRKLPGMNSRRMDTASYYTQALAGVDGVVTPTVLSDRTHVFHQYTLRVLARGVLRRDALATALADRGVSTGVYYPLPLHRQRSLQTAGLRRGRFPIADRMSAEVLSLPVHPGVTDAERSFIAGAIAELMTQKRLLRSAS
jgi:perosamine synthetase